MDLLRVFNAQHNRYGPANRISEVLKIDPISLGPTTKLYDHVTEHWINVPLQPVNITRLAQSTLPEIPVEYNNVLIVSQSPLQKDIMQIWFQ